MVLQRIGRYQVKMEIGRGGMAVVYLAHDPRFRRDVAIKVLSGQFVEDVTQRARFEREAQTIAALEHPAIVPVYDFGEENGQLYLVMRYMPGGSLADRLRQGPLPTDQVLHILARLASALDAVHAHGIVHRDLKPGNILFDQYNEAYLSDFGIVRLTQATTTLTGDAIIGTPSYMSPEQVRGEADLDGRSDIYALGAILYEMLTGRQPYEATTPMGVALKHITEPVPRILDIRADLPQTTQWVIQKAMAKDRKERFERAGELADTLKAILEGKPLPMDLGEINRVESQKIVPSTPTEVVMQATVAEVGPSPRSTGRATLSTNQATSLPLKKGRAALPLGIAILGSAVLLLGLCALLAIFAFDRGWFAALRAQVSGTAPSVEASNTVPQTLVPGTPVLPTNITRFTDDFSNPKSGWVRAKDDAGETDYAAGSYRILVEKPKTIKWATPKLLFRDVSISVEASKVTGADESFFGVLCRLQRPGDFYALVIRGDGVYNILKFKDWTVTDLDEPGWNFSEDIHQGKTTNQLRVECIHERLTLYANGMKISQAEDRDFAAGDVGLIAATSDIPGISILFDRFTATQP